MEAIQSTSAARQLLSVLAESEDSIDEPTRFADACWILLSKPHIVNSRLTGCEIMSAENLTTNASVAVSNPLVPGEDGLRIRRRLIPRNSDRFAPVFETCVFKRDFLSISTEASDKTSEPVVKPSKMAFLLNDRNKVVVLGSGDTSGQVKAHLVARFVKWANAERSDNTKQIQIDSLSLISMDAYSRTSTALKKKYGRKLVDIWTEKTDPMKFVYEDIAIASYLISLWDPDLKGNKVSFIDVGCGNGLLVYILLMEGHRGIGLDVRRRGIWDLYPDQVRVCLKEEPVTPDTRHTDFEWWIGNHSDELTPWIPLLATMSSAKAKVFLLPCCPFGLYGKFQRSTPSLSQYQSYLTFLKDEFLPECGFKIRVDKMRIPSTKRVCFVATDRTDEDYNKVRNRLSTRIEAEKKSFVPREREIKVKNCSQVDKEFARKLVDRVAKALIDKGIPNLSKGAYNSGGSLPLPEAVALVSAEELLVLKSQCGGLQTLLRNHYHIFKVSQGMVQLRLPDRKRPDSDLKSPLFQTRECWFNAHHPQGCPLDDQFCRYKH